MIISPSFLNSIAKENNITEYSQESILLENRNYFLSQEIFLALEAMMYFYLIVIWIKFKF